MQQGERLAVKIKKTNSYSSRTKKKYIKISQLKHIKSPNTKRKATQVKNKKKN